MYAYMFVYYARELYGIYSASLTLFFNVNRSCALFSSCFLTYTGLMKNKKDTRKPLLSIYSCNNTDKLPDIVYVFLKEMLFYQ